MTQKLQELMLNQYAFKDYVKQYNIICSNIYLTVEINKQTLLSVVGFPEEWMEWDL